MRRGWKAWMCPQRLWHRWAKLVQMRGQSSVACEVRGKVKLGLGERPMKPALPTLGKLGEERDSW